MSKLILKDGYWVDPTTENKWNAEKYTEDMASWCSTFMQECYYCTDCTKCFNCSKCIGCSDCTNCHNAEHMKHVSFFDGPSFKFEATYSSYLMTCYWNCNMTYIVVEDEHGKAVFSGALADAENFFGACNAFVRDAKKEVKKVN